MIFFDKCQCTEPTSLGHGLLPNQDIADTPEEEVAVGLIGPWTASIPYGDMEFFALMCIDTTRNLATMLLLVLSMPSFLGFLIQFKSSMTMGESSLVLPFNTFYIC